MISFPFPLQARWRWGLPFLLLLSLLLPSCTQEDPPAPGEIPFQPEGVLAFERPDGSRITAIAIEVAGSDSAQARGLMERRKLSSRTGMFFPYEEPDRHSFWMANTYIPLDIIFVGPDSQIVDIAKNTRPLSEQHIRPDTPAQYVVEVRAGFADRYGLSDSTRIDWRLERGTTP